MECSFPECDRKVSRKGLCATHYQHSRIGKVLRPLQEPSAPGRAIVAPTRGMLECDFCSLTIPFQGEQWPKHRCFDYQIVPFTRLTPR